jgi:hypothetical protein
MHKSATKYNETLGKWGKNKHGASKIMDTSETYQPPAQEIAPRVTRASVKKVPAPRNLKRLKKAKEPDVSLEVHESSASPRDVSERPCPVFFA